MCVIIMYPIHTGNITSVLCAFAHPNGPIREKRCRMNTNANRTDARSIEWRVLLVLRICLRLHLLLFARVHDRAKMLAG